MSDGYTPSAAPALGQYQAFLAALTQMTVSFNAILTQLKTITPSLVQGSAQTALTAHAGGGQASALQLSAQFNRVSTVATAADSVALPVSSAGMWVAIANDGASSMQVFGVTPDTINNVATATGVALPAGHAAIYFCAVAGKWSSVPNSP